MNPSVLIGNYGFNCASYSFILDFPAPFLIAVLSLGLIGYDSFETSGLLGTDKLMGWGWGMGRNKRATNRVLLTMHGRAYNFQSVLHE